MRRLLEEDTIMWSRLLWDMHSKCSSSGCCHVVISAKHWHSVVCNAGEGGSNSSMIVARCGNLVELADALLSGCFSGYRDDARYGHEVW